MLLGSSLGKMGNQPSRNQRRIFLSVAAGLLLIIFLWTTSDADGTSLTHAMGTWPAAVSSTFSGSQPPDGTTDVPGTNSGSGSAAGKYEEPLPPASEKTSEPPLFLLVGDSTTNGQANDGGGWGSAFIWLLARGAEGVNRGINGALSTGYYHSPMWLEVLDRVNSSAPARSVYVTIQFGHNDQNPDSNVTLGQFEDALASMARDVVRAGGTPILVSPLARRDFADDGTTVIDNLADQREATHRAHAAVLAGQGAGDRNRARFIDLNTASRAYLGAIGRTAAFRYNRYSANYPVDTTHLNEHGALVFGRIVADLILGHPPSLVPAGSADPWAPGRGNDDDGLSGWLEPNPYMTGLIWHGDFV